MDHREGKRNRKGNKRLSPDNLLLLFFVPALPQQTATTTPSTQTLVDSLLQCCNRNATRPDYPLLNDPDNQALVMPDVVMETNGYREVVMREDGLSWQVL